MELGGLADDVIGGELVDLEEVHLGLQLRQFGLQLLEPLFGGAVEVAEAIARNLLVEV